MLPTRDLATLIQELQQLIKHVPRSTIQERDGLLQHIASLKNEVAAAAAYERGKMGAGVRPMPETSALLRRADEVQFVEDALAGADDFLRAAPDREGIYNMFDQTVRQETGKPDIPGRRYIPWG